MFGRFERLLRRKPCCCTEFYWCVECQRHTDKAPSMRRSLGYCEIHGPHPGVARPLWWERLPADKPVVFVDIVDGELVEVEGND